VTRAEMIRRLFSRRAVATAKPKPRTLSGRCWNWTGAKQAGYDYGKIRIDGFYRYVHRVSAHLWLGMPLDSALFVRHRCIGNQACFNPSHLLVGTQAENNRDISEQGRHYCGVPTLDERGIGSLIWGVRSARRTIAKWAVLNKVPYKTAYNAYHGITHTAVSAKIHERCDARFGADGNPIINPRRSVHVAAAGCRVTRAGVIVVDPVAAGVVGDECAYANDAIPF
jgi:hypothetical protein